MAIAHFTWTAHAEQRLHERHLTRPEVEEAIRKGHGDRIANIGRADWLVQCLTDSGVSLEAVYDHPVGGDATKARIVSAWRQA